MMTLILIVTLGGARSLTLHPGLDGETCTRLGELSVSAGEATSYRCV